MEFIPGVFEVLQPSAPKERMTALEKKCAIRMENITKRFGSKVIANKDVNLELYEGEILSLLGENGSGKTTLMNMLSGIYFPDEGQIYVHDKPVTIASPKDAFDLGIGMIHQHFKLVDLFTATENIILGLEGKLDLNNARQKVKDICDKYGFDIDPDMKIYDMSVSQKQTVEIVKVLYRGADILILDEPTAVLTPQETDKLFAVMRNMKADGKSLIIITHKLHEVLDVSDRVAVLRKGEYIGDVLTKDADQQSLTDMMVGHSVSLNINRPTPVNVEPRLKIEGLTVFDELGVKRLDNVSFTVNAGEVLGVAGIAGSGQRELLESIAGLYPSTNFPVRRMSGGNVQKVLVGREIAQQPSVLMTAYAVRGLDINTSYTIYNLLTEQKMKGVAVVYVGEDLDVLLELCDRIVVLCGGQVSGVVDGRKTNKLEVGALMTRVEGGKADE